MVYFSRGTPPKKKERVRGRAPIAGGPRLRRRPHRFTGRGNPAEGLARPEADSRSSVESRQRLDAARRRKPRFEIWALGLWGGDGLGLTLNLVDVGRGAET